MLHSIARMHGLAIQAKDGEVGVVEDFYFDDDTWAIRYLVVDTSRWLGGRSVLISPIALGSKAWASDRLTVALTRKQIENSPPVDTHRPVSRQEEATFSAYYGYPYYWGGGGLWGAGSYPIYPALTKTDDTEMRGTSAESLKNPEDVHLRSVKEVKGYAIDAADGEIGHVHDLIVEDQSWAIRYLEVATRNWWPGKKVLVSPQWVENVSWTERKVGIGLFRKAIQTGPEYRESAPIYRDYEQLVYDHYGLPGYWLTRADAGAAVRRSKAS